MLKRILMLAAGAVMTASLAYAAPVDLPSSLTNVPDEDEDTRDTDTEDTILTDKPLRLSIGAEADWLNERELDNGQTLEGETYMGKLGLGMGTFDIYGNAGMTSNMKIEDGIGGRAGLEFDDSLIFGGGASAAILQLPEYQTFTIFADAKYRTVWEPEVEKATVGGATFSSVTENDETGWQEYQGALGMGVKINYVLPYVGVKYSEVQIETDVAADGTTYRSDDVKSNENVGAFGGVTVMPHDAVSFDVQGRFIDEEAVTGKVTFKF